MVKMEFLKGVLPNVFGVASPDEPVPNDEYLRNTVGKDRLLLAQAEKFIGDFTSRENWTNATLQKRLRELAGQNVDQNGAEHAITVQELAQKVINEMGREDMKPMFYYAITPIVFSEELRAGFEKLGATVPEQRTFDQGLPPEGINEPLTQVDRENVSISKMYGAVPNFD